LEEINSKGQAPKAWLFACWQGFAAEPFFGKIRTNTYLALVLKCLLFKPLVDKKIP
jgi:hypothetical protein